MKKIISMLLVISLVSGCNKASILKSIQPANNQIIQSNGNHSVKLNDNQTGQSNNSQVGQPNDSQNTETDEQKHYLTGRKVAYIAGGLVVIVLLALAGYAVYRHYYAVPANPFKALNLSPPLEFETYKLYTLGDIEMRRIYPIDLELLTPSEYHLLFPYPNPITSFSVYRFLFSAYETRYHRISPNSAPVIRENSDEQTWIMLAEFNKEMAERRATPLV
jgi:hypothetical protein